jgi:hypothetical protein
MRKITAQCGLYHSTVITMASIEALTFLAPDWHFGPYGHFILPRDYGVLKG